MRHVLSLVLLTPLTLAQETKQDRVPDEVVKALASKEADDRLKAIRAVSKFGLEAVPHLVKALRDGEPQVSQQAAYALRILKVEPAALVKALSPHARDKSPAVRAGVAGALNRGGGEAAEVILPLLGDDDVAVRRQTVQSLAVLAAKTPETRKAVLAGLAKRVKDDATPVRLDLARALPRCGDESAPALLTLADDREASVRAHAVAGLGQLKMVSKEALPVLVKKAKDDPDTSVRQSALRTLGRLGKDGEPAVLDGLKDKEPAVQLMAMRTLPGLKPDPKKVVPLLEDVATKSENDQARGVAVQTLGRFGDDGEKAILRLLKRDDSAVRLACLQHLGRGKAANKGLVPDLIKALGDKEADVRALAAYVLGQIGPDAKEALPALKKLLGDEDERTKKLAKQAVEKVEGK